MPLYRHWKEGDAEWGIWKVSESAEELRAMLTGSGITENVNRKGISYFA